MAVHHPATRQGHVFSHGEVFRITGTALVAGAAVGYLLAHWSDETLDILARIAGSVGLVTVVMMIFEARRRHQLEEMRQQIDEIRSLFDARLERERRWAAYSDALEDLGGISGEDSGDITIERRRR